MAKSRDPQGLTLSTVLNLPCRHLPSPGLQCVLCRDVFLPPGTLYRVAGFPLSLPCAVSGYDGPRTQDFEWFLIRDDAEGRQMGVVSTRDEGFPYAPFQARVKSGEVRVERDSGDKVRLVIQRLRADDQGKYECYTPSTDTTYQGNYSTTVPVKGEEQGSGDKKNEKHPTGSGDGLVSQHEHETDRGSNQGSKIQMRSEERRDFYYL